MACIAETGACIGGELRPGDRGVGERDIETIMSWLRRLRKKLEPNGGITVRIDSAGDCAALLAKLDEENFRFVVKLKVTEDLVGAALTHPTWRITNHDAQDHPTEHVGVLNFRRSDWTACKTPPRVIALRSTERIGGQQVRIWEDPDESTQFYVTNDWQASPEEIPRE